MKYNDFYAELTAKGCYLKRHGGNHDIWYSPITDVIHPIPRHGSKEVPKGTERRARKVLGV
ncbi:MAG: type II toxin-antitoxin system HicA family toxin [Prevotellaceae bacterium]|nr:type II toxin-antitoxin system HicA family toxin [Prevotellaceae bacterium]